MDSTELLQLLDSLGSLRLSSGNNLNQYSELLQRITECTGRNRRCSIAAVHWQTLIDLDRVCGNLLKAQRLSDNELFFLTDLMRCLRNFIAKCCCDEHSLNRLNELVLLTLNVLLPFAQRRLSATQEETVALRCCLQVFGNLVCQHTALKTVIWKSFNEKKLFRLLLSDHDLKVQEYSMMILYNCLLPENQNFLVSTEEGHQIIVALTDSLYDNLVDWGFLIMQSIVNVEGFMKQCYAFLPTKNRLLFLDVLAELFDNMEQSDCCLPAVILLHIKDFFVEYILDILKTSESSTGDLKSAEIIKLLSLMCVASVSTKCSGILQGCTDLLELSLDALKSVHLLGKHSCNAFSAISSLKDTQNVSKEGIEDHPSFGFKKNLIRLIGNMCSKCKENQDLVRRTDGIPLLLDCCNLDARNPYIMQWCVLAICNVMENNPENQEVLANVTVTGEMVDSALLRELGLQVELQNGRAVLRNSKAAHI